MTNPKRDKFDRSNCVVKPAGARSVNISIMNRGDFCFESPFRYSYRMAESRDTLYLVDGSGYMFRAFHAIPPLNNSRGLPTNATYGFLRMVLKLLKDTHPSHIAMVFDPPGKTFRDDLFESYKANRTEMPSDLGVQIPYIHRAVEALRMRQLVIEGFEADDVIGTLALRAAREKFDCVIVTGDKDFKQLVSPHITLLDTMSDKRVGVREVREQFGVDPEAVIDIMALMGDSIDNVKGLPGVGPKTASAWIQHFGSLEGLFAGLDRLEESGIRGAAKLRTLITEHRGEVELARKLVRIETDVALELGIDDLAWAGHDEKALADLMRELEFNTMLAELTPAQRAAPANSIEEIRVGRDDLPAVLADLARSPRITLNLTEGGPETPELDLGANGADVKDAAVLKLKAEGDARLFCVGPELFATTATLIASPTPLKTVHDVKHHIALMRRHGIDLQGVDFDTMLAGSLINPEKPEPTLGDLYHQHMPPLASGEPTGSEPALAEAIRAVLAPLIVENGLSPLLHDIEIPVARVLAEMEAIGIAVDAAALAAISSEFGTELVRLERECFELAGHQFNLNSPNQLRDVLFNELKLSAKGLKKTKSGFSTDVDTLEKLAEVHTLPRKLIEYRTISKLKSTYADSLSEVIHSGTGRIHTTWHQALVPTGRVSSSDPNLQNIPTRSVEGRRIRRAFVPKPGCIFVSADYSQIDLRVMAHLSGDKTLVDAFTTGEDIHIRTATEVLGVTADKVNAEARRLAKVINFGIIYGMGSQRLAGELGIALAEASDYIKRYFERLPGVRAWLDDTVRIARTTGYVTTMYGRRRYLPELNAQPGGARAQAERIAINTPIQGTAADLIKL